MVTLCSRWQSPGGKGRSHLEELLLQGKPPDAINTGTQDRYTLFRRTGKAPGPAGALRILARDVQIAFYLFGRIADKRKLLKDEADEPLSEIVEHKA